MQPGEGAFDDPPADAQPTAVGRAAAREDRHDAARPQPIAMRLGVIAPIALERARPAAWAPGSAADRGERVDEGIEMRDVVDVGGGYVRDERDAARVGDEVVLGALLAAIGWVRSSFCRPRRRSSASSASCRRCHTPVRCQRTNRRQHVLPDPQPIWRGSICHGIPDRRTNRIPERIARSGIGVRPCRWPRLTRRRGSNGASRAQMASSIRA